MSSPPITPQVHAIGLGHAEIRVGDAVITPASDRLFALAFQLCLRAGEYIPRDELIALFWCDAAPTKGRHSLRQMLYRLRQMGLPLFDAGDAVHLPEAAVHCDVREVLRDGWELDAPAAMVRAGGERIAGGAMDHSEAYREWYDAMEARVRSQLRRAALRHLSAARREGRWRDLEEWALHVLRHDALNEEATLGLAESMVMQGSKARALELLDGYLRELGDKADRIGLPARVLRKRIVGGNSQTAIAPGNHAQIIGRETELRKALAFLQRPSEESGSRQFVIQGAAGSGKSRLAAEIADAASLRGFTVIYAPCYRKDSSTELSGVRSFAKQLIEAPGCAAVSPSAMQALRSLEKDDTATHFIGLPHPAAIADDALLNALSAALNAVSSEGRVLIVFEDVHHLAHPERSLPWRATLGADASRLRLILTARSLETQVLEEWIKEQRSSLEILRLQPLDDSSTLAMTRALLEGSIHRETAVLSQIARTSAGNPLFAHALAAHVLSGGSLESLPSSLDVSLSAAFRGFSEDCVLVLENIVYLGSFASLTASREASAISPREYNRILSTLENEGVVRLDSRGILRVHECWAAALESHRPRSTTAHQRIRAAEFLTTQLSTRRAPEAGIHAAALFAQGGAFDRAFNALIAAGDTLYEGGLAERALWAFESAATTTHHPPERAVALLRSSLCRHTIGDIRGAYDAAMTGIQIPHDGTPAAAETLLLLTAQAADTAWRIGHETHVLLTRISTSMSDGRIPVHARQQAGFFALRILFNDRQSTLLEELAQSVRLLAERYDPTLFGDLALIVMAAERGDSATVTAIDNRLSGMYYEAMPAFVKALALRYLSQALRWVGQYRRAIEICSKATELTAAHELTNEASILAVQAGFLHLDLAEHSQASSFVAEARALSGRIEKSAERDIAVWHLHSRLLIQSGEYQSAYELLIEQAEAIRTDILLKRQCAAAAMLSLAAAAVGDHAIADEMLHLVLPTLYNEPPALQLDFPVEIAGQALRLRGKDADCHKLTETYLNRRKKEFPVPIAPAFSRLGSSQRSISES